MKPYGNPPKNTTKGVNKNKTISEDTEVKALKKVYKTKERRQGKLKLQNIVKRGDFGDDFD